MGIGSKLVGWSQRAASSSWTIWCFLIFGILVRLIQYVSNRSLWLDEAMLAKSIVSRSYLELLNPLEYNQFAPIAFLWIEKFFCNLIGPNEYGLRLFPLICGIISVILFYHLAAQIVSRQATVIAVIFYTCTHVLIYYSAEVKQYSTEVLVGLVLFTMALKAVSQTAGWKDYAAIAVAGIVGISLSFSGFILLAGIGTSWLVIGIRNRNVKTILVSCGVSLLWLSTFLLYYFLIIRRYPIAAQVANFSSQLEVFWQIPPHSISELLWPLRALNDIISNVLSMKFTVPVLLCILFGTWSLWKKNLNYSLLVVVCLAVALMLSVLRKYPFGNRLILYLAPFFIIWISEGIDVLRKKLEHSYAGIYFLILFFLIYIPVFRAVSVSIYPIKYEEMKPALEQIEQDSMPNDLVYVYHGAWPAFEFYQDKYNKLSNLNAMVIWPPDYGEKRILDTISQLKGTDRVWILFTHCFEEEKCLRKFTQYMMGMDYKLTSDYEKDGAWLYLYTAKPQ